ncbi:MAG: SDR family oxidoreductase [Alphaproteobacteria bacterium]|nr:SDR family oxidoreductase [Alphaproteobacteria bacterium]
MSKSNAGIADPAPTDAIIARYPDLRGGTVFVSGGASGIGAEIVRGFSGQGALVHFVDLDAAAGAALVSELTPKAESPPVFTRCDVTDTPALEAAITKAFEATGALYALINNAANDARHSVAEADDAFWDNSVAVNLKHQFMAARAAHPLMKAGGGGSIVNFGSIAPWIGVGDLSIYNTCKAGVLGLTRSLARDFGPDGIRVNALFAGAILTERQRRLWIDAEREAEILERQCLKRPMIEADVVEMTLFLASAAARGCTAQEFRVDGGFL